MYSFLSALTHLRYIVYRDAQNKKQVIFWTENIIHASYARGQDIKPTQMTSLGYVGFHKDKWVLYEHYQLDGTGISNEWREKKLIREKLSYFPEIHDRKLQQALAITYQKEKNILLTAAKQAAKKAISEIKNKFNRTRN